MRRTFVHHEHGRAPQQRARHAQQLPLSRRKVGAALGHLPVEPAGERSYLGVEAAGAAVAAWRGARRVSSEQPIRTEPCD